MVNLKIPYEALVDNDGCLMLSNLTIFRAGRNAGLGDNSRFQDLKYVASGSFGDCWKASCGPNGRKFAVKVLATPREWPETFSAMSTFNQEIAVCGSPRIASLPKGSNVNTVVAYGKLAKQVNRDDLQVAGALIYEYCNAGDLDTMMQASLKSRTFIPEAVIWKWLIEALETLRQLTCPLTIHGKPVAGILHDDLAPSNIFFKDSSGGAKVERWPSLILGDWGLASVAPLDGFSITTPSGSSPNTSPWFPRKTPSTEVWQIIHIIYMIAALSAPARRRNLPNPANDPWRNWEMYSKDMMSRKNGFGVVVYPLEDYYSNELEGFFRWALESSVPPTAEVALTALSRIPPRNMDGLAQPVPRNLFLTYEEYKKVWEGKDMELVDSCQ